MIALVRLLQRNRTKRMEIYMKERKRGGGERHLRLRTWLVEFYGGWQVL